MQNKNRRTFNQCIKRAILKIDENDECVERVMSTIISDGIGMYRVRRLPLGRRTVGMLVQSLAGPCALLALCNVLILRNWISIPMVCIRSGKN